LPLGKNKGQKHPLIKDYSLTLLNLVQNLYEVMIKGNSISRLHGEDEEY